MQHCNSRFRMRSAGFTVTSRLRPVRPAPRTCEVRSLAMANAPFVSTGWLAKRLDAPDIVVVDGSCYLPAMNRDAEAEYRAGHIPGAVRFDIDTVKDQSSTLPHMLPAPEAFASAVRALGIGDGMFSAPRVWWTFRTYGARDVAILEGGFPAWQAEGHPVEEGPGRPRTR